nr:hypothetical protein [Cupriavidus sp. EM10]
MTAFLTPATRLMSRLTITRKLVLLSVLFLIPLCGALFAVLNQSVQSIRDTRDELRGLKLVNIALDFMRETQVRRGAANGVLLGNASSGRPSMPPMARPRSTWPRCKARAAPSNRSPLGPMCRSWTKRGSRFASSGWTRPPRRCSSGIRRWSGRRGYLSATWPIIRRWRSIPRPPRTT